LEVARCAAGLPDFCFHDLRHYFISTCVMAGIDYLTIARWVGHRDGGVLIGRVYGHLNDEHAKKMATLLVFGEKAP
jgi:integrase